MKWMSLLLILSLTILSCNKKEEEPVETASTVVTEVATNLQQIQTSFTPASMSSTTAAMSPMTFKVLSAGAGPCTDLDFFACQSVLVKLYFDIGKSMVGTAAQLVSTLGSHLGQLADGASGTVNTAEGGTVVYTKTSADVFTVLAKNATETPSLYIDVNNNSYTLKFDIQALDATSTEAVKLEMAISFTSAQIWSVDLYMHNATCSDSDPAAPQRIKIALTRDATIWVGKAMLYHPHWGGGGTPTCATDNAIGMYTDFIGSDSATKGSLYLIPGAADNLSTISTTYPFNQYCSNFASTCGDGTGLIPASLTALYPNPFCSTTTGVAPAFNNDCSAVDTTVAAASYSATSLWVAPSILGTQAITLPTALAK
jgi:hypothetical protein